MVSPILTPAAEPPSEERITFYEFLKKYEGIHAEWHPDGTVEVIVTQNLRHIDVIDLLLYLLQSYFGVRKIGRVIGTGLPLKNEGYAGREPDLIVVLGENENIVRQTFIEGAPDIVIEVVSPESVARDYATKFSEYEQIGVREYWMVDPQRKTFDVYERGSDSRYLRRIMHPPHLVNSALLPGFSLDPTVLWREKKLDLTELMALISKTIGVEITVKLPDELK